MAIYRSVQLSFWTDNKVVDDFTPEDRYFYLYLFTNPQTNLCGCYEVSLSTMAAQLGYNKDSVERLLERFETFHKVIRYSKQSKEILLLNWSNYNWQGGNQEKCLLKEISSVKNIEFRRFLKETFELKFGEQKGLISPLQATVTVTDTDIINSFSNKNNNKDNYLNIYKAHPKADVIINNPDLHNTLIDWMDYKDNSKPKDKNYYKTERAIKTFITTIVNATELYGVQLVIQEVDKAISNNWLGVHFEDLQKNEMQVTKDTKPKLTADEIRARIM